MQVKYVFATLGAYAINSSFLDFNVGSGRALASAGYVQVGCGPRSQLRGGRWRDDILLSCFNPATARVLWPDSDIPSDIQAALIRTQAALDWARQVVQPR